MMAKVVVRQKELESLAKELRSRAISLLKRSHGGTDKKSWWQDGKANGLLSAADALQSLCSINPEEVG